MSRDRRSRSRSSRRGRSRSPSRGDGDRRRDRSGSRDRRRRRRDRSDSRGKRRSSPSRRRRSSSPRRGRRQSSPRDRRRRRRRSGSSDTSPRRGRRSRSRRRPSPRRSRSSRFDRSKSPYSRYRSRSPGRDRYKKRDHRSEEDWSDYDRRDRRSGKHKYGRRKPRGGYRVGDRVEIKRKTGWMAGEIEQITPSMYGRTTYTVWIDGEQKWEKWVDAQELRAQRGITKEIAELVMENRELKGRLGVSRPPSKREHDERSFAKPGRASRGRRDYAGSAKAAPRGPSRDYHREAQSEMGHDPYYPDHRGGSMPAQPGNYSYTWPEFIADLTHAVYNRDKEGDPAHDDEPEEAEPAPPRQEDRHDRHDDHKKPADEEYDTRDRDRDREYDDDVAYNNPRALMQDTKNGGNQASDEVIFQGKHERGHPQNYGVHSTRGGGYQVSATKGGGGQGPLIYVNYMLGAPSEHGHEPYSNRNDRYDHTPGHN